MLTDFALENVKLTMLFALIGTVVGLSHLHADRLAKIKSMLSGEIWRGIWPHLETRRYSQLMDVTPARRDPPSGCLYNSLAIQRSFPNRIPTGPHTHSA